MATGGSQGTINVTPLIDVLLVLLIIFMVIVPVSPVGLDARVPREPDASSPPPPAQQDPTVLIQIDNALQIRINGQEPLTDLTALGLRLREIFQRRARKVVFVTAHPDVEFQHVARAIDTAKGAGIDHVGLLGARHGRVP